MDVQNSGISSRSEVLDGWSPGRRTLVRCGGVRARVAPEQHSGRPVLPAAPSRTRAALPAGTAGVIMRASSEEKRVIRYMGQRKNDEGVTVYVFIVNGLEKQVREHALKQHPGCYEALPASAKARIAANRDWLSKL